MYFCSDNHIWTSVTLTQHFWLKLVCNTCLHKWANKFIHLSEYNTQSALLTEYLDITFLWSWKIMFPYKVLIEKILSYR